MVTSAFDAAPGDSTGGAQPREGGSPLDAALGASHRADRSDGARSAARSDRSRRSGRTRRSNSTRQPDRTRRADRGDRIAARATAAGTGVLSLDRTRLGLPRHSTVAGTSTISFLLGLLAATFALVAPTSAGPGHGILVAVIGLGAIACGLRALTMRSTAAPAPRAARLPAGVGITLGGLSTLAVVYTLVAFVALSQGIRLPDLPTAGQPAAAASAADARLTLPNPLGEDPSTPDEELAQLKHAAESAASALRTSHTAGLAWPSGLVEQKKSYPVLVSPDGTTLTPLPAGTRVTYSSFDGGSMFVFTMTGARFGEKVHYNSLLGVIDTSQ